MRRLNFGISCMAIASLFFAASSCSDDLDEENGIQNQETEGETAYLNVTLVPSTDTRAAQEFVAGSADEQNISTADFYFFFQDGSFSSHRKVYNSTVPAFGGDTAKVGDNVNIEFSGSVILTLKNLTAGHYPATVVTILNEPTDFEEPKSLADLADEVEGLKRNAKASDLWRGYRKTNTGDFIMTSSSYEQKYKAGDGKYYSFVTQLNEDDFKATQSEALAVAGTDNAVKVYIERLAVKVNVAISATLKDKDQKSFTDEATGKSYVAYRIGDTSDGKDPEFNIDGTSTKLYAKIISWGMDAQMPVSNYMKQIDDEGTTWDSGLGFTWNSNDNYRSYWGKAFNYDKYGNDSDAYTYPLRYETNLSETKKTTDPMQLVYLSANELTTEIGTAGYCSENTNTSSVLGQVRNYKAAVTSALVKAVLVNASGVPQTVISLGGDLYTKEGYKTHVIQQQGLTYHKNSATGTVISSNDLDIVSSSSLNGQIQVALKTGTGYDNIKWFDEDGNEVKNETIDNLLASYNDENNEAVLYQDGLMYYCIPIRHLRNIDKTYTDKQLKTDGFLEGVFGVVRNHLYAITIDDILNIGHGISDPDEPIVPPLETTENFYLGVNINILSWYNVSQNVTL